MKKFFTPLCVLFICISSSISGQNTIVNDFEAGSPAVVSRYGRANNINVSIIANPNPAGLNTTANCAKIIRTTANWYELFAFNTSITIPANTKKYLHMLVNYYAQPDISIRINAVSAAVDGSGDIRALNKYTDLGNWQDLVFEMDGGAAGRTVNAILVLPDLGFNNLPVGRILNETDKFGYIDQISFSDSSTPLLSVNGFEANNSIAVYPNPAKEFLTISNLSANSRVSISSIDGKRMYNNENTNSELSLSVKEWAKGTYIVRIQNETESTVKKVLID